jgi:hypothetical protein
MASIGWLLVIAMLTWAAGCVGTTSDVEEASSEDAGIEGKAGEVVLKDVYVHTNKGGNNRLNDSSVSADEDSLDSSDAGSDTSSEQ